MDKSEQDAMIAIPEISKSMHSISMSLKVIAKSFEKYVSHEIKKTEAGQNSLQSLLGLMQDSEGGSDGEIPGMEAMLNQLIGENVGVEDAPNKES